MAISAVISYPGAKWKAWEQIKELIPRDIKEFREPFFGGGSVSLSIAEDPEFNLTSIVVGDLAPEIWAFWTACRDYAPDVVQKATEIFEKECDEHSNLADVLLDSESGKAVYDSAIEQGKQFFAYCKKYEQENSSKKDKDSLIERAARLILVNKISFSGTGYAGSMSKEQYADFKLYKLNKVLEAQPLLQRMEIKHCSFEETMAGADEKDSFIFLDPPYYNQEKSGLYGVGGNTHHGFPHDEFAKVTRNTKCRWLITYDDSIKVRRMFKGMYIKPFKITYTMAGNCSEDALAGEELFIANYDIRDKISDSFFS